MPGKIEKWVDQRLIIPPFFVAKPVMIKKNNRLTKFFSQLNTYQLINRIKIQGLLTGNQQYRLEPRRFFWLPLTGKVFNFFD